MQLAAEEIRKTSSRKSHFLRSEYARMAELERRAESACRESRDRAVEVAVARAEGQHAEERATTAEKGLEAANARQEKTEAELRASLANTEVALQEALAALDLERAALESVEKALEVEQRARSEADREMHVLLGQVMETEDASARLREQVAQLREQVARQAEDLSTLEDSHVELVGKVEVLEWDLETTKAMLGRRTEELAKSREERRALEGDLDQIRNVAQHIVSEIFGSAPSTSAPAVQLAEVLGEVRDLIRSGLFYGASGLLTTVGTHHPHLDFTTICSGYTEGMSMADIQSIEEHLLPHARSVADQVSAEWVMDVHREDLAKSTRGEDAAELSDGEEPGSEVNVAPVLVELDAVPSRSEQPTPSSVAPSSDVTGSA
ncbi:uncharacterized protein [Miscanthus floridulus]|uniref:uncharacterized protein n=1 Tax=Miscanthus floridulus TaxID=154761 RepID=UPI003459CED2